MSATTKPMYRKYYEVWSTHRDLYGPRTALLYQVGGFFEIYDTENLTTGRSQANIREIADLCQLSLTVHPVEGNEQTLFGGFPEHALAKFERIMVLAGFTVVVVVQKKGRTGAVEERVVDHISSPGCYVEGIKERRLVGCVVESLGGPAALRRVYWAAAALDIATGRVWFVEGSDRDRLHQFLCTHPPSELLLWSDGLPAANALTDSLKTICDAVHLRCLASASVALEESALAKVWPVKSLQLGQMPQARRCLAALMDFAREHVPSALKQMALPEAWLPSHEVRLGNAALEQLGLLSLSGRSSESLLGLMDKCRSIAGRRLMRARLMRPVSDIAALKASTAAIAAVASPTTEQTAETERCLRSLYDTSRLFRRLELGSATLADMACILRSYESTQALLNVWSGSSKLKEYLTSVFAIWDTDATVELGRNGPIPAKQLPFLDGVHPELWTLFNKGLAIRAEVDALCESWSSLGRSTPEKLHVDDAEGGGFRITGTKRRITAAHAVLRDGGDLTVTITPYKSSAILESATLEAISARHRAWHTEWSSVWLAAWSATCADFVERGRAHQIEIERWCASLDVSWTVSRLAAEWNWVYPEYVDSDDGWIKAEGLRHPILEQIHTQVPYVPHDICLTAESPLNTNEHVAAGFLLYGMNASGKSSLMKAVGLCTLLAQCGFPVPARRFRLSPFTAIFTRILGNDNLWAGLSSFAVEMTEFREILQYADNRSLILGDELCAGTESLSATALVAAGVEVLAARDSKFVFATHLHELAALPDIRALAHVKAVHLKVHYDEMADRLVYDRTLAQGSGSSLYGLEVCRALDLPAGYLDRATSLRKTLSGWQAPHVSSYSPDAVVESCAVCGASSSLEMHHIVPQAAFSDKKVKTQAIKDAASNLACLCAKCHDEHHAGRLVISGWVETSAGRQLVWKRCLDMELPAEVVQWIKEEKRAKRRAPTIQRVAEQRFGIQISIAAIQAV